MPVPIASASGLRVFAEVSICFGADLANDFDHVVSFGRLPGEELRPTLGSAASSSDFALLLLGHGGDAKPFVADHVDDLAEAAQTDGLDEIFGSAQAGGELFIGRVVGVRQNNGGQPMETGSVLKPLEEFEAIYARH